MRLAREVAWCLLAGVLAGVAVLLALVVFVAVIGAMHGD